MVSPSIPTRISVALLVSSLLVGFSAAAFATPTPTPAPATVAIIALHARGADLAVDLALFEGAPAKLAVVLESAMGQAVGRAALSPATPGRATVILAGAVERFLIDGFDYRLRLRDGNGVEVAEPASFTVGMTCAEEVCRFVPELGVKAGAALWLEDRLASALRTADPAVPDLLASAVESDPSLVGAARNLSARLAGEGDGSCACRWAYSTAPATCGSPGIVLGIYDHGVRQDGFSAHQVWRGGVRMETFCWTARTEAGEKIRLAFGDREVAVAWPRVSLASCGSCAGTAVMNATFLAGAYAEAEGPPGVATRASWTYAVTADGAAALSASDLRSAVSPEGEDRNEAIRGWTGTAGRVEWQAEMQVDLEAPRGIDWGTAEARIGFDIRATAEAACTIPPHVEVGRASGWVPLVDSASDVVDPNQISVVIGECRPPG